MKTLNALAAVSLSLLLGLAPFALIAVDDAVAAKADVSTTAASTPEHALGLEGR
jgi:hypothetical protein